MKKKNQKPHVNLMICTPGHSMLSSYVTSLVAWASVASQENITWGLGTGYSSHVSDAREITLSGTKHNSLVESRPFQGEITYDKILWIDSDIQFTPQDILRLYKSKKDIITGAYLISNGSVVVYKKMGGAPYTMDEINQINDLVEVRGAGFGFMCVKQGVFEKLSRPWFQSAPVTVPLEDGTKYTFNMIGEDLSWCQRVQDLGYTIWFDPSVKLNHHKMMKLTWEGITSNE